MPLETQTYDLEAEAESLREKMAEHAQTQAEAPVGSTAAQQAAQLGQTTERHLSGVEWARDELAADELTLSTLTNGERRRVTDTAEETVLSRADCYVAAGTYDAPYLEHDPDAITEEDFRETVKEVADLHPAFVDWLESEISNLGSYGADMGKSYRTLVLEQRIQNASQETSG